jgi:hypothetical protein
MRIRRVVDAKVEPQNGPARFENPQHFCRYRRFTGSRIDVKTVN